MGDDSQTHASRFDLGDFAIDEYRQIKVVCVGAGFSGILAAIRFPQKVPNVDLTIYERNNGIGGTWFTNRFPGLACDILSHCYQLTFESKTDWSSFYAPGPEILAYLQSVVEKYKLMPYIKLQHEVLHARFDEPSGKWNLRIRRKMGTDSQGQAIYEEFTDKADVFITALGIFSKWSWPDVEGLKDFGGKLMHSADFGEENQHWRDVVKDWKDKRVGVIGIGSTAIQIVPALQPHVAKVINYVKGKAWICPPFASSKLAELVQRDANAENYVFTGEDKEKLRDPAFYKTFRHELQADVNSLDKAILAGTEWQEQRRAEVEAHMRKKLAKKPWIADQVIPDYGVACRRLTPGPGYLEALCADNVDFVSSPIKRVTEDGIETFDGNKQGLDVLICATGYDYAFQLGFPIIGRSGVSIQEKWQPDPTTYMAICVDGFPNWFMTMGPNSCVSSGSQLTVIERQIDYMVEVTRKLQRERLKSIDVKREAVKAFDDYIESYFPKTVFTQGCRSWYKRGKDEGRIVALWPGSTLHTIRALQYPRWEDFNYERVDDVDNCLYWFGNGQTYTEKTMTGDRAWYLTDDHVDFPPVPL
ncbi:FAD/NAD-binding domain-containing protein [Rhodofomes roseus]|uniref:FAD/NAD-binding domain-containing protein n=1 Tax=Rhodofomes roseus TaxID=34475 RepID=A0ABQ8KR12_9APHY|nr:FAD/NAD-binding domain-containing protein [Rhodofomes roseus]KAH9841071.1 FAD/NAD-binding domain-containing protein [Rhodofomes roseus]